MEWSSSPISSRKIAQFLKTVSQKSGRG